MSNTPSQLRAGPVGYPRVLDYSIFKSLLVPYSKNFTTRSSSRVVTISYFLSNHSNIQKMEIWNFCDWLAISFPTKWNAWEAWASRVGDIRPPLCNCSQSPIFWHLLALSNIDSLSSLKLLKASEIANCCVWQLHVYCVHNRSTMLLFKALTTDTDSILVQSLFHSAH